MDITMERALELWNIRDDPQPLTPTSGSHEGVLALVKRVLEAGSLEKACEALVGYRWRAGRAYIIMYRNDPSSVWSPAKIWRTLGWKDRNPPTIDDPESDEGLSNLDFAACLHVALHKPKIGEALEFMWKTHSWERAHGDGVLNLIYATIGLATYKTNHNWRMNI